MILARTCGACFVPLAATEATRCRSCDRTTGDREAGSSPGRGRTAAALASYLANRRAAQAQHFSMTPLRLRPIPPASRYEREHPPAAVPFGGRTRGPRAPEKCHAGRCPAFSTDGKPFCVDHVDMHAYVQRVYEADERWVAEVTTTLAALRSDDPRRPPPPVDVSGPTARDVLALLIDEPLLTGRAIAGTLGVPECLVDYFLEGLAGAGRIELVSSGRRTFARLPVTSGATEVDYA